MSRAKGRSRGFTLIAALLVLALLSAIAVSLLFMVHGAGQVGGNDLESNRAYYGAESGMELLTANLAALYQQNQSPTPAQLTNLTNSPPDSTMISGMTYQENISWTPDANGNPASKTSVISSGPSAGLTAEIIPLTLKVNATRPGGASVNMTRGVEVALIPVFQFGVFSDSDLSYFAGPPFAFQGRVHTNGNLFLAANSGPLVLDAKVTAAKEIIRDRLANNYSSGAAYQGDVYVPNQNGGCDPPNPTADPNCLKFAISYASWNGGIPPAGPGELKRFTQRLVEYFDRKVQWIHRQRNIARRTAVDAAFCTGCERLGAANSDHSQAAAGRICYLVDRFVARVQQGQHTRSARQHRG